MAPTARSHSADPICVGLGLCALDHTFVVDPFPGPDDKIESLHSIVQGGGPVPTALCTLGAYGIPTAFIGKCGADPEGRQIKLELEKFGVNTQGLMLDPASKSPRAFIIVEKTSGKRTVILDRSRITPLNPKESAFNFPKSVRYLLIDGRETGPAIAAAKSIREMGGEVVLDAGSMRGKIEELLQNIDHLIVSSKFARDYTKKDDPLEALNILSAKGFKAVVITRGEKGCVGADSRGNLFKQDAFKVDVVDTTGAGDVFHGAYIYGLIQGWDLPRILKVSSAVAALKCTGFGGRAIPSLRETYEFIINYECRG